LRRWRWPDTLDGFLEARGQIRVAKAIAYSVWLALLAVCVLFVAVFVFLLSA
jgi:hypothetical protein